MPGFHFSIDSTQSFELCRVIRNELFEFLKSLFVFYFSVLVRCQKQLITRDQETPHSGFHIHHQFFNVAGFCDYGLRMFDPLRFIGEGSDLDQHDASDQNQKSYNQNVAGKNLCS